MNTHRRTTRFATIVCASVGSAGLLIVGAQVGFPAQDAATSSFNPLEHEARRFLVEARQEQERVLNPGEHLARRDLAEDVTATASTEPTSPVDPCSARLAQAWRDLGHFSDAYETYLLTQPPCAAG